MKIICIDRNYDAPGDEPYDGCLGNEPVLFLKPNTVLQRNRRTFFVPDLSADFRFGMEIVVRIDRLGKSIARRFGSRYYNEVSTCVSITEYSLLNRLKKDGKPWEISHAFDNSAVVGKFIPLSLISTGIDNIDFRLDADKQTVMSGNTKNMLFTVEEIIEYASRYFTLSTGDLIFTGAPAETVRLDAETRVEGYVQDRKVLEFKVR
ncbi:MAG: fumarylacetoacetate hydrolase family protein [Dysgonamonadaceae bacterium]|jgi:2-keto-4-pentenoate hydratase/2-oxohepta-3-ene-1,7-dioic acid hydratase in catechol pathway|nr:fumarylacetoacetate hydrolase family protein [Dysgonamonadaceae bacterium]